jgi:hypothetical protein
VENGWDLDQSVELARTVRDDYLPAATELKEEVVWPKQYLRAKP